MRWPAAIACSSVVAISLRAISTPIRAIVSLNVSRSSPRWMASRFTPITRTPYWSRTPRRASSLERLRPVWPPRLGRSASGRSFLMISVSVSASSGSMYVASAMPGSVMMVAGLEFTRTIRYPSFLSALQAWVPE